MNSIQHRGKQQTENENENMTQTINNTKQPRHNLHYQSQQQQRKTFKCTHSLHLTMGNRGQSLSTTVLFLLLFLSLSLCLFIYDSFLCFFCFHSVSLFLLPTVIHLLWMREYLSLESFCFRSPFSHYANTIPNGSKFATICCRCCLFVRFFFSQSSLCSRNNINWHCKW